MQYLKTTLFLMIGSSLVWLMSCKDDGTPVTPKSVEEVTSESDSAFIKTVEFKSLDDLLITADHYHVKNSAPVIILFHQAGSSRGEYQEIAPRLNEMGYNCLAVDQRSGGESNGIRNETAKRAEDAGKGTNFGDAKQDLTAAIQWAKELYNKNVIIWGSSYSSSLVLIEAKENVDVEQVLSFSPGEYLSPVNVKSSINGLDKPAFLSSAKQEESQTKELFDAITSSEKVMFIPASGGRHGSSSLWSSNANSEDYWTAVQSFLGK